MAKKKSIPDVVIAKPGYNALVNIGDRVIKVNARIPFKLRPTFTDKELKESRSLLSYMEQGIILGYKEGMEYTGGNYAMPDIPILRTSTEVIHTSNIKVEENKDNTRKITVNMDKDLVEQVGNATKKSREDVKRDNESLYADDPESVNKLFKNVPKIPKMRKLCKVIKVTGWRTAILDSPCGNREHTTFCIFPWD